MRVLHHARGFLSRASLRIKIACAVGVLALSVGLGAIVEVRGRVWRSLSGELDRRAEAIVRDLAARAADLMASDNDYGLHVLVTSTVETDEDVVYAFVQDREGAVVAHSFGATFPIELLNVTRQGETDIALLHTERGRVHDRAQPILGGLLGTARVGLSEERVRAVAAGVVRRIAAWTIVLGAAGLFLAVFITRAALAPLVLLRDAAVALAKGDFSRRPAAPSRDEIGALAKSFAAMADSLATAQRQLERTNAELRSKERRLAELLRKVLSAQEDERLYIARELHDETGPSLTSLMIELRVLESLSENGPARERAARLRRLCADILESIQSVARHLRPGALDALGLDDCLHALARDMADRFHFRLDFQVIGEPPPRRCSETELVMYRIVQEALTNVAKHAGASHVSLILEYRRASLFAIVEDDGRGFSPEAVSEADGRGLGLFGMQERAALLDGSLTIESRVGEGTTVYVELPLEVVA